MNSAKVVAITQPIVEGINNAEEFIAYAARVSNPANQMNTETAPKLLAYCIKNKHWSVFETATVTMEIDTTRDIGRQLLRHRSYCFQEVSQRYTDPTKIFDVVFREARLQDNKNRQNSISTDDEKLQEMWLTMQRTVAATAETAYEWAIENGIAKEVARCVLPEGMTGSRLYVQGTVRSWITYIALREKNGTQKEHRELALSAKAELTKYFPAITEALGGLEASWII